MRVIARGTLNDFVKHRVEGRQQAAVKAQLDASFAEVSRASWTSSAQLKQQFRTASVLSSERVVVNIKGNDFRLVTAINYAYGVVLIKWIGSHREYDKLDVREVEYEKSRYTGLSDSDGTGS